jgi:hypothetical protein
VEKVSALTTSADLEGRKGFEGSIYLCCGARFQGMRLHADDPRGVLHNPEKHLLLARDQRFESGFLH